MLFLRTGNTKMQLLRETAIGILNSTSPNYDAAREVIGQYLHLLQMFYSNTNWVEMNADKIYEPLGNDSELTKSKAEQTYVNLVLTCADPESFVRRGPTSNF